MTDSSLESPCFYDLKQETLARDELAALQMHRLRELVARVSAAVPFYRAAFAKADVTPDKLRTLDDLRRLPFTVKDDLRQNYPLRMLAVDRQQIRRVHATSGTTGKPVVVAYTDRDLNTWADLIARMLVTVGVRPGDMMQNASGYGLFTGGLGIHYGAERLGCTVVPTSGGNTVRQVMLMRDLGVNVLHCTPSYASAIAEVAESEGIDLRGGPLRIGLLGAEPWTDELRVELERRLGFKAIDCYGLAEVIGPGVACECMDQRAGLHVWEDHFLVEIVDPRTLEPVPPGERGEMVITTLTKEALPVVRFRTRDITAFIEEPCACGRTHRRLQRIGGRTDDMLIIRGVNVYPSQIESVLMGVPGLLPHYRLLVGRGDVMDELTVEVEAQDRDSDGRYRQLADAARYRIKSIVGINCKISVKPHGSLPRFEGKAARTKQVSELSGV